MVDDSSRVVIVNINRKWFVSGFGPRRSWVSRCPYWFWCSLSCRVSFCSPRAKPKKRRPCHDAGQHSSATVLLDALNAETGVRGFALTGDVTFLQPYYAVVNAVSRMKRRCEVPFLSQLACANHDNYRLVDSEFASLTRVRILAASGATKGQLLGP